MADDLTLPWQLHECRVLHTHTRVEADEACRRQISVGWRPTQRKSSLRVGEMRMRRDRDGIMSLLLFFFSYLLVTPSSPRSPPFALRTSPRSPVSCGEKSNIRSLWICGSRELCLTLMQDIFRYLSASTTRRNTLTCTCTFQVAAILHKHSFHKIPKK